LGRKISCKSGSSCRIGASTCNFFMIISAYFLKLENIEFLSNLPQAQFMTLCIIISRSCKAPYLRIFLFFALVHFYYYRTSCSRYLKERSASHCPGKRESSMHGYTVPSIKYAAYFISCANSICSFHVASRSCEDRCCSLHFLMHPSKATGHDNPGTPACPYI